MPQHDAPTRSSRGVRRGLLPEAFSRRLAVIAIVTGAMIGFVGAVSAQEAGQAVEPGSQLDPNNPSQTGERSCEASNLPRHDGFEKSGTCVETDMGEVSDRSPSALITSVPENAAAGEAFQISASVRNVVRDRFAPAAKGGYYLFMSQLNEAGLTHGHAHIYVQNIGEGGSAPDSDAAPLDFFKAVEDGGGGADPDTITVDVPGLQAGSYRACVTLGDQSHRLPLTKAAKIAAGMDCVRFTIAEGPGGETTTTAAPETTAPDTTAPDTSAPDTTNAPETTVPDTSAPETTAPEAPPTTQPGPQG
jgi:hypothetical protein